VDAAFFRPFLRPSDAVLDFGCGNGGIAARLRPDVRQIEGLEVNPHAAAIASSTGLHVYPSIDALPEAPTFDAVISNHVLEHVRDPAGTLERLHPSLQPGARVLLKLPVDDWRSPEQRRWEEDDIDHHLHTWTPKLAGNLLAEAGYSVERVELVASGYHPKLFPLIGTPLEKVAFRMLAVVRRRRQVFAVGRAPHP